MNHITIISFFVFSIPRPKFMYVSALIVEQQFVCEYISIYSLSHVKNIIKGLNSPKVIWFGYLLVSFITSIGLGCYCQLDM